MFKTLVIPLVIIVVIGWVAYGTWRIITHYKEKDKPEQKTKHLEKVKNSFDDYTKKLENYKRTPYERK